MNNPYVEDTNPDDFGDEYGAEPMRLLPARAPAIKHSIALGRVQPRAVPTSALTVRTVPVRTIPSAALAPVSYTAAKPKTIEARIAKEASVAANAIATAQPQVSPQVASGGGSSGMFEPEGDVPLAMPKTEVRDMPEEAAKLPALLAAPIAPPAKSDTFWTRLLALFGIKRKTDSTIHGEYSPLRAMTESVVRRARNGDQNAMALMALVRDNARKGDPRAIESFAHLQEYVRCNPVTSMGVDYVALTQSPGGASAQWGVDPQLGSDSTYPDAVALSHGKKLTNPRIGRFLSRFGAEEQAVIKFGLTHKEKASEKHSNPKVSSGIRMGKIIGQARKLQAVREPHSSISQFDSNVGWELGE